MSFMRKHFGIAVYALDQLADKAVNFISDLPTGAALNQIVKFAQNNQGVEILSNAAMAIGHASFPVSSEMIPAENRIK
jgi:hypothetical protein